MQYGTILKQRYEITKKIGGGGFGDTYLAEDLHLPGNPKCVVKHLKPKDPDPGVLDIAQRLFEREAETLYKLGRDSEQIPKLFAHFQEGTEFYLVQEYIEGHDISRELTSGKKLSESYTLTLLKGILEALAVAHQNSIVHRDIKPQNLMRRKSDSKIVLIDFGAVREISVLTTGQQPGTVTLTIPIGTPGYMPSEQANGLPKLSSDIYAVGMVGIKALTGQNPQNLARDSKTGNVIWRNEARVSDRLANILDRMVQEYFAQRYENAMQVLEKLGFGTATPRPQPNKTRRQILILGGLAGSGFVGAMLTKYLSNKRFQRFTTVIVNNRGEIISRSQGQAEVMTENLGNGVTLEMVKIPGGKFLMGSLETEAERNNDESPQHNVDVPEFFMGKYPVTQAQWQTIMGNNSSYPSYFKGAKHPVENINWYEATEFCQKLSQITGKKYSLPSESQWEYACRAGTTTPFYFGETITSDLANYDGRDTYADEPKGIYRQETTDVGIFPPNAFGLYDMHGNVWEWCQDFWHRDYNGAPTDGSAWETGGDSNIRVLRGGAWRHSSLYCRSARRNRLHAHYLDILRGFRIILSI